MRFHHAMRRLFLIALVALVAGVGLMSQDSGSQLKKQIASALKPPWELTSFESINSDSAPWNSWIKDERRGYAATCEDPSRTVEETGGKSDTSSPAKRHPGFLLWLIHRNPTISLDKIRADLDKAYPPMMQSARPQMVGFNEQFIVTCMNDCDPEQLKSIASSFRMKQFTH
jgi:hypothetical protein